MVKQKYGFTLMEILVGTLMLSLLFLAAVSMYTTAIRFIQSAQTKDLTTMPVIPIETMSRRMAVANNYGVDVPNKQLNIRTDTDCAGAARNTPANTGDDSWWHYRIEGNALRWACDGAQATVIPAGGGTVLVPNVNVPASSYAIVNPSGQGNATAVIVTITTTTPVATVVTTLEAKGLPKR
jgi:prepilin-type N-terminal cleavage/methylation domain-containing protein